MGLPRRSVASSLASRALAALLAAWRTIRRAAMGLLAIVIIAAVAALVGYALGRHSVAPKPGEEARLDAVIDSLRQVADWERAQRAILEQKQAAAPAVNIVAPGRVEIVPRDPRISPRMVEIPVEVTQALALERQINASLRVEFDARPMHLTFTYVPDAPASLASAATRGASSVGVSIMRS